VTRPSPAAAGGRGLGIVETLSSCWGVVRGDGETTVWAVLAAPHVNGAAPGSPAVPLTAPAPGPPSAGAARPVPEPEHSAAEA
jgi:hypothetical protein